MCAPRVSVVVLSLNGLPDTLSCLKAIDAIDYPMLETIVVDNGSTDGSVRTIRERFPGATLIETGRDLGRAVGNNRGIRHALARDAEFVLLVGSDTTVDTRMLRVMTEVAARKPGAAAFSAKVYSKTDPQRVHFAGARWNGRRACFEISGANGEAAPDNIEACETDWGCGSAMLVRTEAFGPVGLLDERYFSSWDEIDWCARARAAGYDVLLVPAAKAWSLASYGEAAASAPLASYYNARNRLLWMETHLPRDEFVVLVRDRIWPQLEGRIRNMMSPDCDPREIAAAKAEFQGVLHYIDRRFGAAPSDLLDPD